MRTDDLLALYQATEQDLRYGLGVFVSPEGQIPVIQIHQPAWPRELLMAVREALADGIELVCQAAPDGTAQLHLSARQQVELRCQRDGQTFVLQAPAWDAQLAGIAPQVAADFLAGCQRLGRYQLVLATPAWSCQISVRYPSGGTQLGAIEPVPPTDRVGQ